MTGIGHVGSATNNSATQNAQALSALQTLQALSSLNSSNGVSSATGIGLTQTSASISGLGQLFSNLQQLETQNPTLFKQMASQVASELQSAAQQQTGSTNQFLSNLVSTLQASATTDSLLQMQHHHHTQEAQSYNSSGQPVTSVGDTQSNSGANLQQLFVNLAQQVGAALTV
jgi:hypothetical protein